MSRKRTMASSLLAAQQESLNEVENRPANNGKTLGAEDTTSRPVKGGRAALAPVNGGGRQRQPNKQQQQNRDGGCTSNVVTEPTRAATFSVFCDQPPVHSVTSVGSSSRATHSQSTAAEISDQSSLIVDHNGSKTQMSTSSNASSVPSLLSRLPPRAPLASLPVAADAKSSLDYVRTNSQDLFDVSEDSSFLASEGVGSPMSVEGRRSGCNTDPMGANTSVEEEVDDDAASSSVYRSTASTTADDDDYFTAPPMSERERHSDLIYACPDYAEEVHKYMKTREEATKARYGYMRKQPEVCHQMRQILVDWLIDVTTEYDLQQETLHLAVNYIDRMLSKMEIPRLKLQLLGTTAMMIAAKYEEIYPPEVSEFVYITDDTYARRQVLRMEQVLLSTLDFDLAAPTAVWFLGQYSKVCRSSKTTMMLAQYLTDLSILDYSYVRFRPSVVGAACTCLSNLIAGRVPWPSALEELSGMTVADIYECLSALLVSFHNAKTCAQKAVYEKYSQADFNSVALLDAPESLPDIS